MIFIEHPSMPCSRACIICMNEIKVRMCTISLAPDPHLPLEEVLVPADELELLLPVNRVELEDPDQALGHP